MSNNILGVGYCRWYPSEYPAIGDYVMAKVINIGDISIEVELPEYANMRANILKSELSRRRYKSIGNVARVGTLEPQEVISVDKTKGFIDLSKKDLSVDDIDKCKERYRKSIFVNSIIAYLTAHQTPEEGIPLTLEEMYALVVWPLYGNFDHPYDAFQMAASGDLSAFNGMVLRRGTADRLVDILKQKFVRKAEKFQAKMQISCYSERGIEGIKAALRAGLKAVDGQVKIQLISSPEYSMTIESTDPDLAENIIRIAMDAINDEIKNQGGNMKVTMGPSKSE